MSGVDDILDIPLREAWIELPAADVEAGIDEIVARFELDDPEDADGLRTALRAVSAAAASLPPGARVNNALVLSPTARRVEALLSIRLSRIEPEAYENYLALASAFAGDERAEIINRTVEEVRVPAGPAVYSHDFVLPASQGGVADPALERGFLALFPEGRDTAVEFTILTQNLALFGDMRQYLLSLASGEDPLPPGMEE